MNDRAGRFRMSRRSPRQEAFRGEGGGMARQSGPVQDVEKEFKTEGVQPRSCR